MARDDQDTTRHDFAFVDRDDDRRPETLVDGDYDDDFPPLDDRHDDGDPDPGYAAFASELEDPLADWPSPDASLEELPEMRRRAASAGKERADDWLPEDERPTDARYPSTGVFPADDHTDDTRAVEFTDDGDLTAAPGHSDGDDDFGSFTDLTGDLDPASGAAADELSTPVEDAGGYAPREALQPAAEYAPASSSTTARDADAAGQIPDEAPDELSDDTFAAPVNDAEEDFVDDFLNDLDAPDEDFEAAPDDDAGMDIAVRDRTESIGDDDDLDLSLDGSIIAADAGVEPGFSEAGQPDEEDALPEWTATEDDRGERVIPWVMIAVVALALVLLAAGGYGVVQQRTGLEEQVRELQARLATAVSTEEAEAERERQRQMALENESLAAELEALAAENTSLAEQIAAMETQLGERRAAEASALAAARAQAERAAAAKEAERAATQRAAAERRTATAAATAGPWFVNFGSYAKRDVAERWASQIKADDGEVVILSATAAGKTLYRVRVVGIASRDRAERVATALERQHKLPRLWVGQSRQ